jgi:hypothetical protein
MAQGREVRIKLTTKNTKSTKKKEDGSGCFCCGFVPFVVISFAD